MYENVIEAEELVNLFRKVINGKTIVFVSEKEYAFSDYKALFRCVIEGITITFFVDAGDLDYVEEAKDNFGRFADFAYWEDLSDYNMDPIGYLNLEECRKLREIFIEASNKFLNRKRENKLQN